MPRNEKSTIQSKKLGKSSNLLEIDLQSVQSIFWVLVFQPLDYPAAGAVSYHGDKMQEDCAWASFALG